MTNLQARIKKMESGTIAERRAALWADLTNELLTALTPAEQVDFKRALELDLAGEDIPHDLENRISRVDEVIGEFVSGLSESDRRIMFAPRTW